MCDNEKNLSGKTFMAECISVGGHSVSDNCGYFSVKKCTSSTSLSDCELCAIRGKKWT